MLAPNLRSRSMRFQFQRPFALRSLLPGVGLLVLTAAASVAAVAQTPGVLDVLFERQHLSNVTGGQKLVYTFQRVVSDVKFLGQPFSDGIEVTVRKVTADGKRDLDMQVFHGERARPPQDLTDMTGNPVLVFFLDRAVNNFEAVAGGNRNYFKGKFRDGLREKAKIEAVKVDYAGKQVDAHKITVNPFESDPNALRMLGYEGAAFSVVISEAVPGQFVEFTSHYESNVPDAPKLDERITFAKVESVK